MKIEEMTSKQISDELSSHGVTMHFNSKREKLEEALRATDNVDVAVAEPEINPNVVFLTEQELIDRAKRDQGITQVWHNVPKSSKQKNIEFLSNGFIV